VPAESGNGSEPNPAHQLGIALRGQPPRWPAGFACPACGCGQHGSFRRAWLLYFQYDLPTELPESWRRRGAERFMSLPVAATRIASVMQQSRASVVANP
jgi:hypothetical protein